MKTSSAKGKARRLQNEVALQINYKYQEEICRPAIMGEGGEDIKVYPSHQDKFKYSVECKNQETWSIPQWWKQTTTNTEEGRKPLLVIKKNRHEPLVVMRLSDWIETL